MGVARKEPLTSLDTLYNQAAGAELVLRAKVVHWADASKGLFPLQKGRSFDGEQTWIRVNGEDIDSLEMVKWPTIKTPEVPTLVSWQKPFLAPASSLHSFHNNFN